MMLFQNERPFMKFTLDDSSKQNSLFITKLKNKEENGFRNLVPLLTRSSSSVLYKFDSDSVVSAVSSNVAESLFGLGVKPNLFIVENLFGVENNPPTSSTSPYLKSFSLFNQHSKSSSKEEIMATSSSTSNKDGKKCKQPCKNPPNCCLESESVREQLRNLDAEPQPSTQTVQRTNAVPAGTMLNDLVTGISSTAAFLFGRNTSSASTRQEALPNQVIARNEQVPQDPVFLRQLQCIPWDEDLAEGQTHSLPMLFKFGGKLPEPPEHAKKPAPTQPSTSGSKSPDARAKTGKEDPRVCLMSSPVDPSCYIEFGSLDTSIYDGSGAASPGEFCDEQAGLNTPPSDRMPFFRPIGRDTPEESNRNTDDITSLPMLSGPSGIRNSSEENNRVSDDVPKFRYLPDSIVSNKKKYEKAKNDKDPDAKLPNFSRVRSGSLPQNYFSTTKRVWFDSVTYSNESNTSGNTKEEIEEKCILLKLKQGQKRFSDSVELSDKILNDNEKKTLAEMQRRFTTSAADAKKKQALNDRGLERDPNKKQIFRNEYEVAQMQDYPVPATENAKTSPNRNSEGTSSSTRSSNQGRKSSSGSSNIPAMDVPPPPPNSPNPAYMDALSCVDDEVNVISRSDPHHIVMKDLMGSTMEVFRTSDFETGLPQSTIETIPEDVFDDSLPETPPSFQDQSFSPKQQGSRRSSEDRGISLAEVLNDRSNNISPGVDAESPASSVQNDTKATDQVAEQPRNFQCLRDEIEQAIENDRGSEHPDAHVRFSEPLPRQDSDRESALTKFQKLLTGMQNSLIDGSKKTPDHDGASQVAPENENAEKNLTTDHRVSELRQYLDDYQRGLPWQERVSDNSEPKISSLNPVPPTPRPTMTDHEQTSFSPEILNKDELSGTTAKPDQGTEPPLLWSQDIQRGGEPNLTLGGFDAESLPRESMRDKESVFQVQAQREIDKLFDSSSKEIDEQPEEKLLPLLPAAEQPTSLLGELPSELPERKSTDPRKHSFRDEESIFQAPKSIMKNIDNRPHDKIQPFRAIENQLNSFLSRPSRSSTPTSPDLRRHSMRDQENLYQAPVEVNRGFTVYKQRPGRPTQEGSVGEKSRFSEAPVVEPAVVPVVVERQSMQPLQSVLNKHKPSKSFGFPENPTQDETQFLAGARGRHSKYKQPSYVSELDDNYINAKLAGQSALPRHTRLTIDPRASHRLSRPLPHQGNQYYPRHPAGIILTRPEYYTIPSMEELASITDVHGNCVVPDFTVGRIGYGTVRFEGNVNVTGLNLDEIVQIRRKEIAVYPDDAFKPPLGVGLNRRAEVCLDNSWPIDIVSREPITDPREILEIGWVEDLEIITEKMGAHFLEFKQETGSWVFLVEHFSEYSLVGLCDSQLKFIRRSNLPEKETADEREKTKSNGQRFLKALKKIIS